MEITNKNKEEIEKILKEIEENFQRRLKDYAQYEKEGTLGVYNRSEEELRKWIKEEFSETIWYPILKNKLQERIKTSIQWCKDEIEFLECFELGSGSKAGLEIMKRKIQFRNHLTWLKEQERSK